MYSLEEHSIPHQRKRQTIILSTGELLKANLLASPVVIIFPLLGGPSPAEVEADTEMLYPV